VRPRSLYRLHPLRVKSPPGERQASSPGPRQSSDGLANHRTERQRFLNYFLSSAGFVPSFGPRLHGLTAQSSGTNHVRPTSRAPTIRLPRHNPRARSSDTFSRAAAAAMSIILPKLLSRASRRSAHAVPGLKMTEKIATSALWRYQRGAESKVGRRLTSVGADPAGCPAAISDGVLWVLRVLGDVHRCLPVHAERETAYGKLRLLAWCRVGVGNTPEHASVN
jgi:hypothetical protein